MEKMSELENNEGTKKFNKYLVFSKTIRTRNRTYFFDVKKSANNENYLAITESKKIVNPDGTYHYEKHKIFLFNGDLEPFANGLSEIIDFFKNKPYKEEAVDMDFGNDDSEELINNDFAKVEFEDLKY